MLLLPGEAPIRLVTLKQKIQWDKAKKAFQEPTKAERSAFARLTADVSGKQGRLRITGPLVSEKDGAMRLEVREYEWLPAKVAGK